MVIAPTDRTKTSRAWTLVELMVALAIVLVFTAGIVTAFMQILRVSDRSERLVEAHENARAAVEAISLAVKTARAEPSPSDPYLQAAGGPAVYGRAGYLPTRYFQGINIPTLQGDRRDNDGDDRIDEEQPDGRDDDGDWLADVDDRHAMFGGIAERRLFVGRPDLGDGHVDDDTVFHHDRLRLASAQRGGRDEITSYSIGAWEGEPNVLRQEVLRVAGSEKGKSEVAPVAFNVLSLNLLYWDANQSPPYWVEEWDASTSMTKSGAGIELPAAVYIAVTVYAGRVPLDQLGPDSPIETVTARTVVNVENVIHDPRYELIVRPTL